MYRRYTCITRSSIRTLARVPSFVNRKRNCYGQSNNKIILKKENGFPKPTTYYKGKYSQVALW